MSSHGNLLIYLNLGGEMLYVLRQRLKAQKVRSEKAIKVLDDVTVGLLNPNNLSTAMESTQIFNLSWLRSTMESIALCSIMKLDDDSMNKLFDLMTMMVKYQFTAATGPREIILITLNHIDSLRGIINTTHAHQSVTSVHQMVDDYYGNLTYNEIWQARNDCLEELNNVNVRVSILLKLGIQNEDTTFNITASSYNEKFLERRSELGNIKLMDNTCRGCNIGSLVLFGDRITLLGRNIYSPSYANTLKAPRKVPGNRENFLKNHGMKAELGMLAMQLGTDEGTSIVPRPFSLNLLVDDVITPNNNSNSTLDRKSTASKLEDEEIPEKLNSNEDYREKLSNVCADFVENDYVEKKLSLLQLLDEAE